jgi:pimeloyl-ACP methyl ester carboxylesterase
VGELDPVTPIGASQEIVAALPPGIAQLEVIEGAGHWAWKDAPDAYLRIVRTFIQTISGEALPG